MLAAVARAVAPAAAAGAAEAASDGEEEEEGGQDDDEDDGDDGDAGKDLRLHAGVLQGCKMMMRIAINVTGETVNTKGQEPSVMVGSRLKNS